MVPVKWYHFFTWKKVPLEANPIMWVVLPLLISVNSWWTWQICVRKADNEAKRITKEMFFNSDLARSSKTWNSCKPAEMFQIQMTPRDLPAAQCWICLDTAIDSTASPYHFMNIYCPPSETNYDTECNFISKEGYEKHLSVRRLKIQVNFLYLVLKLHSLEYAIWI